MIVGVWFLSASIVGALAGMVPAACMAWMLDLTKASTFLDICETLKTVKNLWRSATPE